jgi:hypothetical protein
MIIETRIPTYALIELDEVQDHDLQTVCKRFAQQMTYNIEYDYYSIYWEEQNWLLAKLAMPAINHLLTRIP